MTGVENNTMKNVVNLISLAVLCEICELRFMEMGSWDFLKWLCCLWPFCQPIPTSGAKLRRHGILTFYRLTKPLLVSIVLILNLFQWTFCRGPSHVRPHSQTFVGLDPGPSWDRRLCPQPGYHTLINTKCSSNLPLRFSERELTFTTFTFAICYRPSVCRLSVVCNVCAPYSSSANFRQYFYGIRYLGHPLISTENFTEIVPGNHSARGVKHKRGSKI